MEYQKIDDRCVYNYLSVIPKGSNCYNCKGYNLDCDYYIPKCKGLLEKMFENRNKQEKEREK